MQINSEIRNLVKAVLEYFNFKLHVAYSGRFMFGRECFGFSTDDVAAELKFAVAMLDDTFSFCPCDEDRFKEDVKLFLEKMSRCARCDCYGVGTIYYYPEIQWGEDEQEEEED